MSSVTIIMIENKVTSIASFLASNVSAETDAIKSTLVPGPDKFPCPHSVGGACILFFFFWWCLSSLKTRRLKVGSIMFKCLLGYNYIN